ncbi:MAG: 1-deoxy-D-xylulose-5-phosphate reductoisomerase, partial [Actinomycetales bacterium]
MRNVILLGSTGSIGRQTLEVIERYRQRFKIVGLAAGGSNIELFAAQIVEFNPEVVAL